jgi:hemoglobin
MRPTLYEFAGGAPAFQALASAHHARCLADPELNHPFSHRDQHPQHVERLGMYWAEVMGGPPTFTAECRADQSTVLVMHAGHGDMTDLGERFLTCFVAALDDAGLPSDGEFRTAMRDYMRWAVDDVLSHSHDREGIPPSMTTPRWSWDGLQRAAAPESIS